MLGGLKGVMKNRGLGMNVKKVLYDKVVVPTQADMGPNPGLWLRSRSRSQCS